MTTLESLFELFKCDYWSVEAISGVHGLVNIRVCTALSITAT